MISRKPNMINAYSYNNSVTVKNKMYVISHENFDIYDGKKFVSLKRSSDYAYGCETFSTGNKIHVVKFYNGKMLTYDTVKDEWSAQNRRTYRVRRKETLCMFG